MPTIEQMLALIDRTDRAHVAAIASGDQDNRIWMLLAVPMDTESRKVPRVLADFIHEFESRPAAQAEAWLKKMTESREVVCTRKPLEAVPDGCDDWWLLQMQDIVYAAVRVPSEEEAREADEAAIEAFAEKMQAEFDSRAPHTADEWLALLDVRYPVGTRLVSGANDIIPMEGDYHEGGIRLLRLLLEGFVKTKRLPGQVLWQKLAVRLGPRDIAVPSLCWTEEQVVLPEGPGPAVTSSAPPFVAEYVTSGTAYVLFRPLLCAYERAGVKELWLIDAREDVEPEKLDRHSFFRREGDLLVPVPQDQERIESAVFPGFWVNRSWFSGAPADHEPLLREILGS